MGNFFNTLFELIEENTEAFNIIIGAVIFIFLTITRNRFANALLSVLSKMVFKNDEVKKQSLINSLKRPVALFVMVLGLFIGIYINVKSSAVVHSFKIISILIICWGVVNFLSDNMVNILHIDNNSKLNTTALNFVSNIMKIVVIAFAVVMIISELGYNINGLLTGLGVGGLAVSLAAQDAVSNLISGFIIVTEKPFKVGDYVEVASVQGTIQEVTMRSTILRTLDDSLVTIPNSSITNEKIINISKMEKRLLDLEYNLTYSTSNELLKKCQEDIKNYLKENENIIDFPIRVEFEKLDSSSLNLNVFCYTSITDIHKFKALLSEINYNIRNIIEKNGAEFAFPSTSVYIEKK